MHCGKDCLVIIGLEIEEIIEAFGRRWKDLTEGEIEEIKARAKSIFGEKSVLGFVLIFDCLMVIHSIKKNHEKLRLPAKLMSTFYNKIFFQIDNALAEEIPKIEREVLERIKRYIR